MLSIVTTLVLGACAYQPEVCFSPEGSCDKLLISTIDKTKKTLDVQVYYLTHAGIVDAILRVKARGVTVRVVTDDEAAATKYQGVQVKRLRDAGIVVKKDTSKGIMHLKVVIVDTKVVVSGSFNFTGNATKNNDENLIVFSTCPKLADKYTAYFQSRWDKYTEIP